jgi:hypothetical protein
MFHVTLQSEELAYNTKTGKCLQTYALRYESHNTKLGIYIYIHMYFRCLCTMGDVTVKSTRYKKRRLTQAQKWLTHDFQINGQSQDVTKSETLPN